MLAAMAKSAPAAADASPKAPPPCSAREYVARGEGGHTLASLARASGVSYATLYRHVVQRLAISTRCALRLERWSGGRISAAKTLGVAP